MLSRHSGEILSGADGAVTASREATDLIRVLGAPREALTRRTLAEAARVMAVGSGTAGAALRGPDWRLDVDADCIVVGNADEQTRRSPADVADHAVEVQVFGLVGAERVRVLCPGTALRVVGGRSESLVGGWHVLSALVRDGELLCAGGPWSVRVAGSPPRAYAGAFAWRPPPERQPEVGETARQTRARRGSDVVFLTTLASYVAGVLAAEHDGLQGEARMALVRVVAHDTGASRHAGRPVCDTTHCQVFRGTARASPEDRRVLSLPRLPTEAWLPYFRGGREPWTARRPAGQVRAILGEVTALEGAGQQLQATTPSGTVTRPCEPVRSALRLPACPRSAEFGGQTVVFRGEGQGHGLGLDVDAAARSSLTANALLEHAYGLHLGN